MDLAMGMLLIAAGTVLRFLDPALSTQVDIATVADILVVLGAVDLLVTFIAWVPGALRRRARAAARV